ncbi:MAG: ParB/RepB/Spo0J family partition protein [Gammaproteobacteria bacterium]
MKKRGLGRGLDALLGGSRPPRADSDTAERSAPADAADGELRQLPVDLVQRGQYQPRVDMRDDTLQELAASIKAQGVVQPIIVRPMSGGRFEIIAGERRWRAAQLAGLEVVPALVRRVDDRATIAMSLIENIQREDLNPLEEARALDRLIREFELTQQEAADAVGRSRSAVANLLRLQELNADVKALLEAGDLDMGHARALLALTGAAQSEAARAVVKGGLTARETEALVRKALAGPGGKSRPSGKALDPNIRTLQDDLAGKLGARVRVEHSAKGKGKLVIEYNSLDELDGILSHIK